MDTEVGLLYKPHHKQLQVHHTTKKRIILNWGRQTGKSVLALNYTWIEAVKKQGRYFIVFPTYQQAYDAIWSQYIGYIPEQLIAKDGIDKSRLIIRLNHLEGKIILPTGENLEIAHNLKLPPSSIELKGSDTVTADRLRGSKVNGIVFDEYAYHDPGKWEKVFEPMLSTTDGWSMFISSPSGFNHFYELWNSATKSKHWFTSHATAYENPNVSRSFLKRVREDAEEKGLLNTFEQEYMAEFRKMDRIVYPEWDREVHLVDPEQVPDSGTIVAGVDFGWERPSAVGLFLIDYDGRWWMFDEIYVKRTHMPELAQIIKEKTTGKHLTVMAADSAQMDHINSLAKEGLPVLPVKKVGGERQSWDERRIALCAELLKPREQLEGRPKPRFFVSKSCSNFVKEIEKYQYEEQKEGKEIPRKPIKVDDHLMDAWSYIRVLMQDNPNQDFEFPDEELFTEDGFYL